MSEQHAAAAAAAQEAMANMTDEEKKKLREQRKKEKKEAKKKKKANKNANPGARVKKEVGVTFNAKKANFAQWYDEILDAAELVDRRYPVKGMPVFRPYGWYMQEQIMRLLELDWDALDIDKAQFPLVIPDTFLEKEKDHVKGFESECFWVTRGGLKELDVKLALRPTSETAMYHMFSLWVQTYRDLPLKVHQTCQVFRHETKMTRPLIRVREIYWNEGHTCHATKEDALALLEDVWVAYLKLLNGNLGVFGKRLRRPVWDKFAGAEHTDVMDTVMPDGRVLQTVGAHYLGQKFANVFNITFQDENNVEKKGEMTCFGVSSRMLAAAISLHGDDKGLIVMPAIAKFQVVIIPIIFGKKTQGLERAKELQKQLRAAGIRSTLDDKPKSAGTKFFYWEMKGVPIRIEVGPRDVEAGQVMFSRRDTGEKFAVKNDDIAATIATTLTSIEDGLREKSKAFHEAKVKDCSTVEEIVDAIKNNGGFARFPYHSMDVDGKDGETVIHDQCGGEIRGYVHHEERPAEGTACVVTGKPAKFFAYAARAY